MTLHSNVSVVTSGLGSKPDHRSTWGTRRNCGVPSRRHKLLFVIPLISLIYCTSQSESFETNASGESEHDGCAKEPLIVITDMEPDDVVAIHAYASELSQRTVLYGTTLKHTSIKAARLERLLNQLGIKHSGVLPGTGGDPEDYPDFDSLAAAKSYAKEGEGILAEELLADLRDLPASSDDLARGIASFLTEHRNVEVQLLTAPTDLSKALTIEPALARNIGRIVFMGGWSETVERGALNRFATFNWLVDAQATQDLLDIVENNQIATVLFSSHVVKPAFNGGSINRDGYPQLFETIDGLVEADSGTSLKSLAEWRIAISGWNSRLIETIPALREVVGIHVTEQFTPADPLAVLYGSYSTQTTPVAVELELDTPDPRRGFAVTVEEASTSPIRLVTEISAEDFVAELNQRLRNLVQRQ